uniref:Aminotransferase class I/classII large domain-containing protein n=1 Tax=Ornithorhynchus anatinus TaxID=9258 RepID=F7GCB7_ORNAN
MLGILRQGGGSALPGPSVPPPPQDFGAVFGDRQGAGPPGLPRRRPLGSYGLSNPGTGHPQGSPHLSVRGNIANLFRGSTEEGYKAYHADKYDEDKNPSGIINFGTSENKLCFDLMSKRLNQSDMYHIDPPLLQYPDWKGHMFLREEVARFLTYYCKAPAPLKSENVIVLNGCGSLFSALATVLCDPGEAILIATPFYGGITQSIYLYGNVRLVYAYLDSKVTGVNSRPFQLTVEKLETALLGAQAEGVTVKGLILLNPQNPLGDIYSPGEMLEFLEFAKRHELHVIVDEIYMLSVFDESTSFHSVLGMDSRENLSSQTIVSGIRFGTLYTENQDVANAVASFCYFHGICGIVQYQMAQLLRDRDWINQVYLRANHARLKAAHTYVTDELKTLGVPFLNRNAGFFVWIDFRKYLRSGTFEEEMQLWRRFLDSKVLLSCGKAFECREPGWFRIIFADKTHRLQLGERCLPRPHLSPPAAPPPPHCHFSSLPCLRIPSVLLSGWVRPHPFPLTPLLSPTPRSHPAARHQSPLRPALRITPGRPCRFGAVEPTGPPSPPAPCSPPTPRDAADPAGVGRAGAGAAGGGEAASAPPAPRAGRPGGQHGRGDLRLAAPRAGRQLQAGRPHRAAAAADALI